jgi:hypothetical protein
MSMDYQYLAERLLQGHAPHSALFAQGVAAALRMRIDLQPTPYPAEGTVEHDAWMFGCSWGASAFSNAIKRHGGREQALMYFRELAGA